MPPLTCKDKALIKGLRVEKGWNVDRIIQEFLARQWKRQTFYNLVRKLTKLVAPIEVVLWDCWRMTSLDLVDTAIDQFSKRLGHSGSSWTY